MRYYKKLIVGSSKQYYCRNPQRQIFQFASERRKYKHEICTPWLVCSTTEPKNWDPQEKKSAKTAFMSELVQAECRVETI